LRGFPKEWDPFISGVVAREKLPDWDRLWNDCCQEEIRRSRDVDDNEEENLALTSKRGGRGRRGTTFRGGFTSGKPKKDLSHVQCYVCGELGHFASQCTQAKKGFGERGKRKEIAASAEVENKEEEEEQQLAATAREFSRMFKDEYTLFLDTEDRTRAGWYIDSGATSHMTGERLALQDSRVKLQELLSVGCILVWWNFKEKEQYHYNWNQAEFLGYQKYCMYHV
jgi:hypothetical protein